MLGSYNILRLFKLSKVHCEETPAFVSFKVKLKVSCSYKACYACYAFISGN